MALLRNKQSCLRFKPWQPILTIPANSPRANASKPHAHPPPDQRGNPQYGASEHSRSPSCAITSFQKGGGERRPASRKHIERSPARFMAPAPQNVRSSPSTNPPPDKKASNEKAPQVN